jgi:formate dehydrogenase subunit gamma
MAGRLDGGYRQSVNHVTTQVADRPLSVSRIVRFDGVQRSAHWANALLFGILMLTALPLYFGSLAGVFGRRAIVAEVHLWTGLVLPVPILISLLGPWGSQMRRDVRRINRWTKDEVAWLRLLGRSAPRVVDKFNPGQKLNAIFIGASMLVMLATGFVLKWFRFFPVSWRTGATFVHDVLAFAIFAVVFGHILFALAHRDSMRSMIKGWVTEAWAARHAPGWLREEKAKRTQKISGDI